MCDFKPGDEVVCIHGAAGTFPTIGYIELIEGRTYTVDAVWLPGERGETGLLVEFPAVQLVELGRLVEGDRAGFEAARFRKIQRRLSETDIRAWVEQPTDREEPKLPAFERKRERA